MGHGAHQPAVLEDGAAAHALDDARELAIRFGVMSIPTVVFLKNGREFDRKVGTMPAEVYAQVLDANL